MIFSYVWGVRVGGLFTALGVTSVVIGLMLQNSVGQIVSGLFMLFEQPFRIGDWLDTPTARGRIVEANWRAVHIQTGTRNTDHAELGVGRDVVHESEPSARRAQIVDNDHVLGRRSARPGVPSAGRGWRARCRNSKTDSRADIGRPPVAASTRVSIALKSPADDGAARATFLRWIWYAARREGLHLDGADRRLLDAGAGADSDAHRGGAGNATERHRSAVAVSRTRDGPVRRRRNRAVRRRSAYGDDVFDQGQRPDDWPRPKTGRWCRSACWRRARSWG